MSFLASGVEKISRYLWKRQCFVPWRSFQFPLRASGTRKCEIKWNWKERERGKERKREREILPLIHTLSRIYPTYSLFLTRRRNVIRSWIRGSCKARRLCWCYLSYGEGIYYRGLTYPLPSYLLSRWHYLFLFICLLLGMRM